MGGGGHWQALAAGEVAVELRSAPERLKEKKGRMRTRKDHGWFMLATRGVAGNEAPKHKGCRVLRQDAEREFAAGAWLG